MGTYAYSSEVEVNVDFTPKALCIRTIRIHSTRLLQSASLPFESNVRIAVYNILGEMLEAFVDETKQVGFHDLN
jgi:hypothetical protein